MREYDGNDNVYIYIHTLYVNIIPLKGFENSKSDETFLYVDRGTAQKNMKNFGGLGFGGSDQTQWRVDLA